MLSGLPIIALVCSLLPAPAQAQFTQQGPKLVGMGALGDALQGNSVSLSADGSTAIVGGPGDNRSAGAAWIFTRSGGVRHSDRQEGCRDPEDDEQHQHDVDEWRHVDCRHRLSQQGTKLAGTGAVGSLAEQGFSVSLSDDGNTAILGGPIDNSVPGGVGVGAAWVFTRSGGVWNQQGTKLVGTGAIGLVEQGWSVSLSGDGNTAIVGGPHRQ